MAEWYRYSALALFLSGTLQAADPEHAEKESERALKLTGSIDRGRTLYKVCSVCHTPEGWGTTSGYYPQIAGQLPSVTIKQMADISSRNRDNPTMFPFAMPSAFGNAQEMADVAAYIGSLPMSPGNGIGPGFDLSMAERLYQEECAECHGERGEGNAGEQIPLIHGQHYNYLMRQFHWIKVGKRRNADQKMVKQIQRFTGREISALMDYVSRIKPPEGKLAKPGWKNPDFPKYSRRAMPSNMRKDP